MVDALLALGLLLIIAKLLEGVAVRLRQSSLIAYVAAGIILGPLLGVIEPTDSNFPELAIFFAIGVIFMFFLIGVDEMDVSGLLATIRGRFFIAGFIAFALPLAFGLTVTVGVLEEDLATAIALAGILALSSLGVVARVLGDMGQLKRPLGLEVFTTVVIVEIIGLLVVSFSLQEVGREGGFRPWDVPILLLEIVGFAIGAWLLASRVFPPLVVRLRRIIGAPQMALGLITGGLFLTVVGVEEIGLHGSLGALLLGMALSGLPHRLRTEILPGVRGLAQGLFIPLFFASAGLYLDLSFTKLATLSIVAVVLAAVLGKFAGAIVGVAMARLDRPLAIASGLMGKGVVEIALLLVMLNMEVNGEPIISRELFSLLIVTMLAFIFLVPPIMGVAIRRVGTSETPTLPRVLVPSFARYALDTVTVENVIDKGRQFPTVSISVQKFVDFWVVPDQQDYVVVSQSGTLVGIASVHDLRKLPKDEWDSTPLEKLVEPHHAVAWPDEPLDDVLERMADNRLAVLPVVDPSTNEVISSITNSDLLTTIIEPQKPGPK